MKKQNLPYQIILLCGGLTFCSAFAASPSENQHDEVVAQLVNKTACTCEGPDQKYADETYDCSQMTKGCTITITLPKTLTYIPPYNYFAYMNDPNLGGEYVRFIYNEAHTNLYFDIIGATLTLAKPLNPVDPKKPGVPGCYDPLAVDKKCYIQLKITTPKSAK